MYFTMNVIHNAIVCNMNAITISFDQLLCNLCNVFLMKMMFKIQLSMTGMDNALKYINIENLL